MKCSATARPNSRCVGRRALRLRCLMSGPCVVAAPSTICFANGPPPLRFARDGGTCQSRTLSFFIHISPTASAPRRTIRAEDNSMSLAECEGVRSAVSGSNAVAIAEKSTVSGAPHPAVCGGWGSCSPAPDPCVEDAPAGPAWSGYPTGPKTRPMRPVPPPAPVAQERSAGRTRTTPSRRTNPRLRTRESGGCSGPLPPKRRKRRPPDRGSRCTAPSPPEAKRQVKGEYRISRP